MCSLLHVLFPGASVGFNELQIRVHMFHIETELVNLDWEGIMQGNMVFYIAQLVLHQTPWQAFHLPIFWLLLTTGCKLAKQVQMFLKSHLQPIFPDIKLHDSKTFLNAARNTAKITFKIIIHFHRNYSSRTTLHKLPEHTDINFHFKSELNLQDELIL